MKKVNIIKDNVVVQFVKFEDEVQMQEWIDMLAVNHPWGKPAHTITTDVILVEAKERVTKIVKKEIPQEPKFDEAGNPIKVKPIYENVEVVVSEYVPAVYETIDVPSEYTVEIIDMTEELAKEAKLKEIEDLKATVTIEKLMEAVLTGNKSFLVAVDAEVKAKKAKIEKEKEVKDPGTKPEKKEASTDIGDLPEEISVKKK